MGKIHQLSTDTIAKIAAGEMIERPAYAVKELIDNAIDAKATYITVDIKDAGFTYVMLTDNGEGMDEKDIAVCFQPHTTSKIKTSDELVGIQSLGFRGEALASIAAISTMTIKSRQKENTHGTLVEIKEGNMIRNEPVGAPTGTTITITNLFSSVPARKKFLKSERSEFRHIMEVILQFVLSYPDIRFFMRHNGKIVLDLPQGQELVERVALVFGQDVIKHLIPIKKEDSYISLQGFLAKPQLATTQQQKQFFYVNNRFIKDPLIRLAIKEAYGTLIEKTTHPLAILFLTIPYEAVDVNVHPRKEEVHFLDKTLIFEIIRTAIAETLERQNLTYQHFSVSKQTKQGNINSYAGQILKNLVLADAPKTIIKPDELIQLHNLYILTETKDGMIIIDQHAAHERIQYEKFKQAYATEYAKKEVEKLEKPLPIELSLIEQEVLKERQQLFEQLGFQIEALHQQTYLITHAPKLFADRDLAKIIRDLLAECIPEKKAPSLDHHIHTTLAYLACRSAIMGGDSLTKDHMQQLIKDLEKTPNNTTCPHGRPTKIETTLKQLNRMFKRE